MQSHIDYILRFSRLLEKLYSLIILELNLNSNINAASVSWFAWYSCCFNCHSKYSAEFVLCFISQISISVCIMHVLEFLIE